MNEAGNTMLVGKRDRTQRCRTYREWMVSQKLDPSFIFHLIKLLSLLLCIQTKEWDGQRHVGSFGLSPHNGKTSQDFFADLYENCLAYLYVPLESTANTSLKNHRHP